MRQSASFSALTLALAPDRTASMPLSQQLYDRIRRAIVARQLRAGERVPSSRSLASQLGVSRNTVSLAYMQLLVEGLLESTIGRGTWVAGQVQDSPLAVPCPSHAGLRPTSSAGKEHFGPSLASLSRRTDLLAELPPFRAAADAAFDEHDRPWAFQAGVPALDAFPAEMGTIHDAQRIAGDPYDRFYAPVSDAFYQEYDRLSCVSAEGEADHRGGPLRGPNGK